MAIWIGAALTWQTWQDMQLQRVHAQGGARKPAEVEKAALVEPAKKAEPAPPPRVDLPAKYVAEAERDLTSYRTGSDPALHDFIGVRRRFVCRMRWIRGVRMIGR